MNLKGKLLFASLCLLFVVATATATFLVFATVRGGTAAAQSVPAAAPPPFQTLGGTKVVWKAPGTTWEPYDPAMITRLGVDVDECIQSGPDKATICVKVIDAKAVGGPLGAITGLFEKFDVDPEDRPRVAVSRNGASFTFSIDSGIVSDAMDIKVTARLVSGRKGKLLMVMGAWSQGGNGFDERSFDLVVDKTELR